MDACLHVCTSLSLSLGLIIDVLSIFGIQLTDDSEIRLCLEEATTRLEMGRYAHR